MKLTYYILLSFLINNYHILELQHKILQNENISFDLSFHSLDNFNSYENKNIFYKNFLKDIHLFLLSKVFDKKSNFFKAQKITHHKQNHKKWTILIYIAGVNDLYKYALRNIAQMMEVGSNENVNIVIHFDFHIKGGVKETKRFYVQQDSLLDIGDLSAHDSGDANNLIKAAEWAIENYPSDNFGLILWNHGTGPCDPHMMRKLTNPNDFFYYNESNNKISLDRSKDFLETISEKDISDYDTTQNNHNKKDRGICFDDTTRNYLDNKKLRIAVEKIAEIRKKKIDIILMDACLMQGIEIAYLCRHASNFLTASEEVVLGPGYNYASLLKKLAKEAHVTPYEFAIETVKTYARTYAPISNDFTQSAINLTIMEGCIAEFNRFIELLKQYLKIDKHEHLRRTLKIASSRELVTHFSEPSYIDLIHFLENIYHYIAQNPKKVIFDKRETEIIKTIRTHIIKKLIPNLKKIIIANVSGDNVPKATGLYIYFPKKNIEESYKKNDFAIETDWLHLIGKIV